MASEKTTVEHHFDFGSPNCYFAHRVIPQIEQRTGVKFAYTPILLGGVFKATNNQPPLVAFKDVANKLAYEKLEITRFIRRHRLTSFRMNPLLSRQHAANHARDCRRSERSDFPCLCRGAFFADVGGRPENGRSAGHRRNVDRARAGRQPAFWSAHRRPRSRRNWRRTRRVRSSGEPSARRPSMSTARSISARTSCARSKTQSSRRRVSRASI